MSHFNPLSVIIPLLTDVVTAFVAPEALPYVVGGQAAGAGAGALAGGGQGASLGANIGGAVGGLGSALSGGAGFGAAGADSFSAIPEGAPLTGSLAAGGPGLATNPALSFTGIIPEGAPLIPQGTGPYGLGGTGEMPLSVPLGGAVNPLRGVGASMLGQQLGGLAGSLFGQGGTGSSPFSIPQGGATPGQVSPAQLSAIQSEKGPGLAPWYINRMQGKGIGPGISGTDPNMMALMMMQQNPEMFGRG